MVVSPTTVEALADRLLVEASHRLDLIFGAVRATCQERETVHLAEYLLVERSRHTANVVLSTHRTLAACAAEWVDNEDPLAWEPVAVIDLVTGERYRGELAVTFAPVRRSVGAML